MERVRTGDDKKTEHSPNKKCPRRAAGGKQGKGKMEYLLEGEESSARRHREKQPTRIER